MNTQTKAMQELMMCYIKQYGFDVVMGTFCGLDLQTIVRLNEIAKGDK